MSNAMSKVVVKKGNKLIDNMLSEANKTPEKVESSPKFGVNISLSKILGQDFLKNLVHEKTTAKMLESNIVSFLEMNYLKVAVLNTDDLLNNIQKVLLELCKKNYFTLAVGKKLPTSKGIVSIISEINNQELKDNLSKYTINHIERKNYISDVQTNLDFCNNNTHVFTDKLIASETNKQEIETFICVKYLSKQINCAKRGIEFNLTFSEFKALYKRKHCYYSGVILEIEGPNKITLDRKDPSLGYISGNVVSCSKFSNAFKNKMVESKEFFSGSGLNEKEKVKLLEAMIKEIKDEYQ